MGEEGEEVEEERADIAANLDRLRTRIRRLNYSWRGSRGKRVGEGGGGASDIRWIVSETETRKIETT